MTESSELQARMRDLGRSLTRQWRDGRAGEPAAPRDAARPPQAVAMSETQAAIWLFEQLHPGTAVNNLACEIRIDGPLNPAVLKKALALLPARHRSLRSTVSSAEPVFEVHPAMELALEAGEEAARAAACRPFDLNGGPLARAVLYENGGDGALLLLVAHHLIIDGAALGPLLGELLSTYSALLAGGPAPGLPEVADAAPPGVAPDRLARCRDYWLAKLAEPKSLDLPYDRSGSGYRGGYVPFSVDPETGAAARSLGADESVTLFTVLYAALAAVLGRVCGQDDVLVGTPAAMGPGSGLAQSVNLVALRSELDRALTFREFLHRARRTCAEALAHSDVPVDSILPELTLGTHAGQPAVQVLLNLQARPPAGRAGGATFELTAAAPAATQRDLEFHLWHGEAIGGRVNYRADLFAEATVRRLVEQFGTLLRAAVRAPDQPLGALPLLTPDEHRRITTFTRGPHRAGRAPTVTDLVAAHARGAPDRTAVSPLTYRQLNHQANRLAHYLRQEHRIGPEDIVAVSLPRTPQLIITLLAVLKTGAAYLPIDPTHPPERLSYLLADSRSAHLISHPATDPPAGTIPRTDITAVDTDGFPTTDPPTRHTGDNAAYLIYTSGSTGRPKGVTVTHHNLGNLLRGMADLLRPTRDDVFAALTTVSFDIAALEIFLPLVTGAALTVVDRETSLDPHALAEHLTRTRATVVQATPATWNQLLDTGWTPRSPLTALTGGDTVPPDLAIRLRDTAARTWNVYGPTETTIWSTAWEYRHGAEPPRSVPIGRPLLNTSVHVLDESLRPVPIGVVGDLYIGGTGVSRGYLDRPALTAERFLPDPFAGPGARMYHTGDLVRWLPDGTLEFLGRADHQVKIRGHRIELGEIEHTLRTHPDVRDAVATTHATDQLAAYITTTVADPDLDAVRRHLRRRLPPYMVPATITPLESIPLTPNGKVNRAALPKPRHQRSAGYTPARTQLEHRIITTWRHILDTAEPIGVHDNFFELGGHSLLATRVANHLRTTLDKKVPLRLIFENPTPAQLAACLADHAAPASTVPLRAEPRREEPANFPASFGQQRMWFLSELDERASLANHILGGAEIHGDLDPTALQRAIGAAIARHEVLRTTLTNDGAGLRQVIHPPAPFALTHLDVRDRDPDARRDIVDALVRDDAAVPFDLTRGPLIRSTLVHTADGEHTLLLALHHAIADGWSMAVLLQEIAAVYHAHKADVPVELAPLPVQYADYSTWYHRREQAGEFAGQLDYWRAQLADLRPLDLPTDRPRRSKAAFHSAHLPVRLPPDLVRRMARLARRENATVHMALIAGFSALLNRLTANPDIAIGTPVAGRSHPDLENLIGFFVNTLVIRTDHADRPSFRRLLRQVRDTCLEAHGNQDVPIEKLVEKLRPARPSGNPLFQVMLVLQNQPSVPLRLPGLELRPLDVHPRATEFDLHLSLTGQPDGALAGTMQYSTELFDEATAGRFVEHLCHVLRLVAADPNRCLGDLPLPSAEAALVAAASRSVDPMPALPADRGLHELIEDQAARAPARTAVVAEDGELTYQELNRRANRLARYLTHHGVGPETPVAVCLHRGLDLVTTLLAILKAGGYYIPLDPGEPPARLATILADCRPRLVVVADPAIQVPGHTVLNLSAQRLEAHDDANLPTATTGDNLAYLIYTSGSTGRPKGVMISHRSIVNHMRWMHATYPLRPDDRVLQKTPCGFDASVWEFYAPLLAGAQLIIARPDGHRDSSYLVTVVQEQKITILQTVPTLLDALLDTPGFGNCTTLRRVFCGGETLPATLTARFQTQSTAQLTNLYGPTEACVDTTSHTISSAEQPIPIGRPIWNARVHVLDHDLNPCPVGTAGTLHIAGAGLARGYRNHPGLTATHFLPDPFGAPGSRLYDTGDLARILPDGTLQYLGRADHQVKIRGHRIELGEIEHALRTHPHVRDAVTTDRLAAYITTTVADPDLNAVRQHLQQRLPSYMVPTTITPIEAIPLTPNGKIDRAALPAPRRTTAYTAARNQLEQHIITTWQHVLDTTEPVGAHDNFFELGGHSLLATRVANHLRSTLNKKIPLRLLFESPTPAELATQIGALPGDQDELPEPRPRDRPAPLSQAQQRLWFLQQLHPETVAYNLPVAIEITGPLDVEVLNRTLVDLIDRHHTLRSTIDTHTSPPTQHLNPPPARPVALRDLDPRDDLDEVLPALAHRPFDLTRHHPLRTDLLRLGDDHHVLLATFHHIATDLWSTGILVAELTALYRAHAAGRPSPLPEPALRYSDYAHWQHDPAVLDHQRHRRRYWRERLAGVPALQLPTDRPRVPGTAQPSRSVGVRVDPELRRALEDLGHEHGVTPFMILVAALYTVLRRLTGQDDIAIGTPVANRAVRSTEDLVGLFVNTLVLRVDLSGDPTFAELLTRVRTACLEAYTHQDVPFEQVVEDVAPDRDLSRSPLFQVMLALQNVHLPAPSLGDLDVRVRPVPADAAKFELTLTFTEGPDGLDGEVEYRSDLFDEATVRRFVDHFRHVLRVVGEDPGRRVGELPLPPAEAATVAAAGHSVDPVPVSALPAGRCVHELIEDQAARTPGRGAVVAEDGRLSYAELNRRANQLARHLADHGVGPETPVAVCLHRGLDLVVALLAVLKAGGHYVPLDPGEPAARLAAILTDCRPRAVIVADPATRSKVRHAAPGTTLLDLSTLERYDDTNLGVSIGQGNLAYLIYTSGSTGRPKGVMITHRSIANHMRWMHSTYPLHPDDRVLQKTPCGFDASIWEFYAPLLAGARLVLARPDGHRDNRYLVRTVQEQKITVLQLVPALLDVLLDTPGFDGCDTLRRVFCGGEALHPALCARFHAQSGAELINLYGPAEACVDTTSWAVSPTQHSTVPIGRPIWDARVHVLDDHLNPCPIGAAGTLYIAGAGLARGYLNRPDLTAAHFIPNPYGPPGTRLYHTGDRARLLTDGTLQFLGRTDHQTKIRGHRVEPAEIEHTLRAHPGVHDAAVTNTTGRLHAYIATADPDISAVREHLRRQLPTYMVPTTITPLEALPRTPNGKIDRAALPAPVAVPRADSRPATTGHEKLVAAQWAHLLRTDAAPGADDNFFELGGNSLLAMRLTTELQTLLNRDVPLRLVFEHPTLARFAEHLGRAVDVPGPRLRRGAATDPIPLSFTQQRLWMLDRMHAGRTDYHVLLAARLTGPLRVPDLRAALDGLVARHEVLRTRYELHGGVLRQVIDPAGRLPLQTAGDEAPVKAFDLAGQWPVRATLVSEDDEHHVLTLTLHHIASDGWSSEILLRDLGELYAAAGAGRRPVLPELPVRYADYAAWQREQLTPELLARQLAYWRERLADRPAAPERRRADWDRPGASVPLRLGRELRDRLARIAADCGTTLFTALLAAFAALVARGADEDDVCVGTDVAGRDRAEVRDVVGAFVNQVSLRIDVGGGPTFANLLRRTAEVCHAAYAHLDVPFEQVAEQLWNPGEDSELFDTKIVYQDVAVPDRFDDLDLDVLAIPPATTKFDATLFLWNHPDRTEGELHYALDAMDEAQATATRDGYLALLRAVADSPEHRIRPAASSAEPRKAAMEQETARPGRFRQVTPRPVRVADRRPLPVVVPPTETGTDLPAWLARNGDRVNEYLAGSGAVLLRGTGIVTAAEFEAVAESVCGDLLAENGEHDPVSADSSVQTPVFYAPDRKLLWHNENSFNADWPRRITFCCRRPAEQGGETPLVDSRRVYEALDPAIRRRFAERQVRYRRTYQPGVGLTWQQVFRTDRRADVEERCRAAGMDCEWLDGDRLRTTCVRPAVIEHRASGRMSWFNQAQHWHPSCLDERTRAGLEELFGADDMPRTCSYGDGTPIEDSVMSEILDVYRSLESVNPWQAGDILVVDNVAVAHGRNPYRGPRELLVAMGMVDRYPRAAS